MHMPERKPRRAATTFILITIMLDMLALGMIAPVLAKLVQHFTGSIAGAAWYVTYFGVAWAAMQFFCSPLLGMLSDRVGRRPVVLISNFATAIDYCIMALAPNLMWLFVGRIISGGATSSISVASAYIADVTVPEKRAAAFGLIGSAFGVGFVLGPAIGGLLGNFDTRLAFWVAAGFSLINFLYGLIVLPESLAPEHRTSTLDWKRANPFGSLKLLRRHRELLGLTTVNFFGYVAHEVYTTVWVLYCMSVFAWTSAQVGLSLTLVGLTSTISSALLVQPTVNWLGERRALLFGLAIAVITFAMFGSSYGPVFVLGIIVGSVALYGPPSQSLMTRHVGPSEQGELQGAIGAVRGIAMIIGPFLFGPLFALFSGPWLHLNFQGAPWYLASLFMAVALIIAWRVTSRSDDTIHEVPAPGPITEVEDITSTTLVSP
jgi:DHA1 family tetracycline resistance protein-like MFS transporter